ncbi:MAG TPA: helix-turn-helix domain-containing protein [Gemmatimonadaceae bacterium]|nr:helix-turn-helix domain-containing protein [Gemmatimonadaceae bacterium]
MPVTRWSEKFYESTRGRIIHLLRRSGATVDQLARALGLTNNAVRVHLATLERDGIIEQRTAEPTGAVGKPAYRYRIAPDVEPLFSHAYAPVLDQLLDVLTEHMSPDQVDSVMQAVGQRLAAARAIPAGDTRARAEGATRVLGELGGIAQLEEHDGTLTIRGASCPVSSTVRNHPEVCRAVEALVAELVGAPVQQHCEHSDRPRCCFEIHNTARSTDR